jgi:glycosyltransferase involved in cell wall biosynthesis
MSSVSVVIPCYNYGHFLPESVDSVLNEQPGVDVRVLIIDDASQDGSADVARKIAAGDPRVEVVVHPVNQGNLRTYNEGVLDWADGDYTVQLSADDRLTPGALRRAVDLMDAHPKVAFTYGHPIHFENGRPLPTPRVTPRGWSVWAGPWWIERQFRLAHSCITTPEVVVRTTVQKQVGGYDLRLPHSGDIEMWMRLAAHGDVGWVRGVDQAFYRVHQHNMTKSRTVLVDLQQRKAAYEAFLEGCADRLPDAARLGDLVHRKLAWEAVWTASRAYDRRRLDQTPVAELIDFAFDCWPDTGKLAAYHALRVRQRIGGNIMPYLQPLILSAVMHRMQNELWWRSWKLRGV